MSIKELIVYVKLVHLHFIARLTYLGGVDHSYVVSINKKTQMPDKQKKTSHFGIALQRPLLLSKKKTKGRMMKRKE